MNGTEEAEALIRQAERVVRGLDPVCDHCQKRPATQKVAYVFDRGIRNLCDVCAERGEEAEDWDR